MPASRYAIVQDGVVEQITLWDAVAAPGWNPPKGTQAVLCPDDLHLGATWDGQAFTNPTQKPSGPEQDKVGADNLTDSERATFKALAAKVAG